MAKEPGASPQVEDGHLRIANELFDALNRANLSGTERRCVDLVIRLSYGCSKTYAIVNHWSAFGTVGIKSSNIRKVIRGLTKKKVLRHRVVGKVLVFMVNKDYSEWRERTTRSGYSSLLLGSKTSYQKLISQNIGLSKKVGTFISKNYPQIVNGGFKKLSVDRKDFPKTICRYTKNYPQIGAREAKPAPDGGSSDPKPILTNIRLKPGNSERVLHAQKEEKEGPLCSRERSQEMLRKIADEI